MAHTAPLPGVNPKVKSSNDLNKPPQQQKQPIQNIQNGQNVQNVQNSQTG